MCVESYQFFLLIGPSAYSKSSSPDAQTSALVPDSVSAPSPSVLPCRVLTGVSVWCSEWIILYLTDKDPLTLRVWLWVMEQRLAPVSGSETHILFTCDNWALSRGPGDWFTVTHVYRGRTKTGTKLSTLPNQVVHNLTCGTLRVHLFD